VIRVDLRFILKHFYKYNKKQRKRLHGRLGAMIIHHASFVTMAMD
jgi:hypothetical protein